MPAPDPSVMVPDNYIVLEWADGEYEFRLPAGQIAELQTKCAAGVGEIFARLMAGRYVDQRTGEIVLNPVNAKFSYEDIVEPIRLGLIGGKRGMVAGQAVEVTPTKAMQLIRDYVYSRPLLENWKVAAAVLSAFVLGYHDPDKVEAAEKKRAATAAETTTAGST